MFGDTQNKKIEFSQSNTKSETMKFAPIISVCFLLQVVGAFGSPLEQKAEKETCAVKLSSDFANWHLDEQIAKLIRDLRQFNPSKSSLSLVEFVDSSGVDLRVEQTGLVAAGQQLDSLVEKCADLVAQLIGSLTGACEELVLAPGNEQYDKLVAQVVGGNAIKLDTLLGSARICYSV